MCRCLCVFKETDDNHLSFAWCDYHDKLLTYRHELWFKCINGRYYKVRHDSIKSFAVAPDYILLNMGVINNVHKLTMFELAELRDRVKRNQNIRGVRRVTYARMRVHGVWASNDEHPKTNEFAHKVFKLLDSWPLDMVAM